MINKPRLLCKETPLLSCDGVTVAAPRTAHGRAAAKEIGGGLEALGPSVTLADDPDGTALTQAAGPVVVVGNLAESRCFRALYFRFLVATDLWYPGPEGYELRTLCDPFGTGFNVIQIGYSDETGARCAVREFIARLTDPIPHLSVLRVTRLPLSDEEVRWYRDDALPQDPWQITNGVLGDRKGYLFYLTGDPELGKAFRKAWQAFLECGHEEDSRHSSVHLYAIQRVMPWRLIEVTGVLLTDEERLAATRFLYGWAESEEGWAHVMHCPRLQSPHMPLQNHELLPALALAYAADYFETHFPALPGPERWKEAAAKAFEPYGSSWKPLCDGLCHGWWLSQPPMLGYGLLDPEHGYFEKGGARKAAECAMAVVNNQGWMPSAGDADLRRQFPGPSLRIAAAYYEDGRYRFVHDIGEENRRLVYMGVPARAFDIGIQPEEPVDMIGVTVVPVDPLVYHAWDRDRQHAQAVVDGPPAAPIEQCFDKLAVRTGWKLDDDYLLIDGLSGGSHSYADAGGILDYSRLGLSAIVSDDMHQSAPEQHSLVTIARNGEFGDMPGFAILEAHKTHGDGHVYLRIRLKDYAGADWIREVYLLPGLCLVTHDTVVADQAGDYAVEARFRTPARFKLHGNEATSRRLSPSAGEVDFRVESLCEVSELRIEEKPVRLLGLKKKYRKLWKERYQTDDMALTALTARAAVAMETGEFVSLTHLAQVRGPGEPKLHLCRTRNGFMVSGGPEERRFIPAFGAGRELGQPRPAASAPPRLCPLHVFPADSTISALCLLPDNAIAVGTERGDVLKVDEEGTGQWAVKVTAPVHSIGCAQADDLTLAVGHGPHSLTALDGRGEAVWQHAIEREPCPWPWWELSTPAAMGVAGGVDQGECFFAVACGDIQLRCFDGQGRETWQWRYRTGVPARLHVGDIDGSGKDRIVCGGDISASNSTAYVLDPVNGGVLAHLPVEGWTSLLTALAAGRLAGRHVVACGANRGRNLHLFDVDNLGLGLDEQEYHRQFGGNFGDKNRIWLKKLGGTVTGIHIFEHEPCVIAATSQGFVLCFEFHGRLLWHKLFSRGIQTMLEMTKDILAIDETGNGSLLSATGDITAACRFPSGCSAATSDAKGAYVACGRDLYRVIGATESRSER